MSSSSKFTLARLFSIESSELIHKLSKDFSEDRTAAIFGNPTYLHRGERKLFKKSAHEDYHFSTILILFHFQKRMDNSYFWKPKLPPERRSGKSFAACSTSLALCSQLSTSIFFFYNLSASRYVVYLYGLSLWQTFKAVVDQH